MSHKMRRREYIKKCKQTPNDFLGHIKMSDRWNSFEKMNKAGISNTRINYA